MESVTGCPFRRYGSETGRGNPIHGNPPNGRVTVKGSLSGFLLSLLLIMLGPVGTMAAEHTLFIGSEFVTLEMTPMTPSLVGLSDVRRWQEVTLNPVIAHPEGMVKGDIVKINPFPDVEYSGVVDSVESNIDGTITVRASLDGYSYGYLMISTSSDQRSLGTIRVPDRGEWYNITSMAGGTGSVIYELDSEMRDELWSGTPLELEDLLMQADEPVIRDDDGGRHFADPGDFGPEDQATIDVMVVYTPAARVWAENAGGIDNVIAQAMGKGQLTLDNSKTYVNLNLVHSAEVNYLESDNSSTDLTRLRNQGDGYMDEVHALRDAYQADLVALLAVLHDVGGRAYLLNSRHGRPDSAFSITRVQQAGSTYTLMHELAHNIGLHHCRDQNVSPGPTLWIDWPENRWSAGWEWMGRDGNRYGSLMTYESGTYFEDGVRRIRVAHISNPDVNHDNVPTGHRTDGDNARTLREMKHVVAAYRSVVKTYTLTYEAGNGGLIKGDVRQNIREGEDGAAVEAVPNDGYYFVQWSDGRTENPRIDRNITTDMIITANFDRRVVNTYILTYEAADGGFIEGNVRQTIREGEDGVAVEAVPSDGYYFVQWSDGRTENPRIDRNITTDMVITADYAKSFAGGEGTAGNPFLISNSEQLARMRYNPSNHFKQQDDIDLDKLEYWEPIGVLNDPFTGVFDGNGHVIKNLVVDGGNFIGAGMFGHTQGAVIRNTAIENADVKGGDNVGILVGYAADTVIEQSCVTGFVSGRENVGGLLGFLVEDVSETMVSNSYADCNVVGVSSVGGLVGNLGSTARIENVFAVGSVNGDNDVGGLVGENGNESYVNVINSYWDTDIGPSTSRGGVGKTTVMMRRENTFMDWNFDTVWGIREDESYPYLQLWSAQGGGAGERSGGDDSSAECFINTLMIGR